jgi:hypothetical protein
MKIAESDASNFLNDWSMPVLHMPFWTESTFYFGGRRIWPSKLHNPVAIVEPAFSASTPSHTKRATPGGNSICKLLYPTYQWLKL